MAHTCLHWLLASSALVLSAGCNPVSDTAAKASDVAPAGADAITPRNPFFGTWSLQGARIAPWWDHKGEEPAPDPAMAKITLEADTSSGPGILTCEKPHYAVDLMSVRSLFDGKLPDPAKDAIALGFDPEGVTTMTFTCGSTGSDVSMDFPMLNDDTIMMARNDVIYTFTRTRG